MKKEIDLLLCDEFITFSKAVADIHTEKKAKKEELKKIYETYQAAFKDLDDKAKSLQVDFEKWKAEQNVPAEDANVAH